MLEGDYRSYSYPHNNNFSPAQISAAPTACAAGGPTGVGCVTVIGGYGQTNVPSFTARDTDFDARLGLKVADPRIYIGVGYLWRQENYGYPKQNGVGFGAEKLPDLDQPFSIYGSAWYYPSVSGNFTYPAGAPASLINTIDKYQVRFLKYQIGGTVSLGNTGLFIDLGFLGDSIRGKNLSPSDANHSGGYAGLGLKF
jgi:hypothetical protein